MPLLSKVRCSIPPSTRMGSSTKVRGEGSPVGGIQNKNTQVEDGLLFSYTDFCQNLKIITKKFSFLVMVSIATKWFSRENVLKKKRHAKPVCFPPHEAKRPWLLAPTPRRMKLVSALRFQHEI